MTVQIFRPTSTDITNGTVTVVGSGGANGVTDDAPLDDSSYITSSQFGAGVSLGLADISLTATQRINKVRGHIRCFHNSADVGHVDEVDWRFRDSTFTNLSSAVKLGTSSNSPVELYTGWYFVYPNNFPWSDARFDRVQVNISWRARATGLTQLRISEIYVEADVHEQLDVTAVSISGNTTTSRPTATITVAADPDLDAQTAWSYAVFTSAQVSAAGFNPETSAAVYRKSGTGASTTFALPVDLTDGFTYQWFVKVAKNWPGSEGPLWYSDWQSSGNFTVTLTAPPTPTLVVTQELTLPSYRNRIVATVLGVNDLSAASASFETNTIGTWVAGTNTNTPTVSATNSKSGAFNLLLTSTTATGGIEALSGTFATSRRVKPGAVISATVSTRAVATARTVAVGIRWFDSAGATISTPMSAGNANTTAGYTTHTLANQTAPANAWSYVLRVTIAGTAASEQHRLDEAGGMRGASATWGQGGYVDSGTITFSRLLRVDPTLREGPVLNWVHEQIRSTGGLLGTTEGFYTRAATDEVVYRRLDRAHPGNPDTSGEGVIDWTIRAGATSFLDIGGQNGVVTDLSWPYLFPVVPGMAFTWGAWAWADSAGRAVRYIITWVDESNNTVGSAVNSSVFTLGTATQAVTVAGTAPAGSVYARVAVENNGGGAAVNWHHFISGIWFRPTVPFMPICDPIVPWDGGLSGQLGDVEIEILRNGEDVPIATDGDPGLVIYDHEAPPDRPVIYVARFTSLNISGDRVSSPTSDGTSVYMTVPARTVLKDPFNPNRAAIVNITSPGQQGRNTVEEVSELHGLDRDDDPVFIRSWLGHERTFELTTNSYLESQRLERLLASSRSLVIQRSQGGQTYIRIKSGSDVRFTRGKDKVSITAAETRRPG